MSIEELDATVHNFYEGRGEAVQYKVEEQSELKADAGVYSKSKLKMP
jgi:hypothetical protein